MWNHNSSLDLLFLSDQPLLKQVDPVIICIGLSDKLLHALHIILIEMPIKGVFVSLNAEHSLK